MNRAIDLVSSYLNSAQSVFAALQRLKNELQTEGFDFAVLLGLLTRPRAEPDALGDQVELSDSAFSQILLASLAAFVVYGQQKIATDTHWTDPVTKVLETYTPTGDKLSQGMWIEGALSPCRVDLLKGHHMSTSKAFAYLAVHHSGQIVITLPGTNSKQDWLSNLHSTPTELQLSRADGSSLHLKVHAGFLAIARTLHAHPAIRHYLHAALDHGFDRLLLAGHSQAGAVVALLGLLLAFPGTPVSKSRKRKGQGSAQALVFKSFEILTFGSGAWCDQSSLIQVRRLLKVNMRSFVRCKRDSASWRIDPVPFVEESLLSPPTADKASRDSTPKKAYMLPAGQTHLLVDRISDSRPSQIRKVSTHELQSLSSAVWLNLDPSAHSMAGYVAHLLRWSSTKSGLHDDLTAARRDDKRLARLQAAVLGESRHQDTIDLLMVASQKSVVGESTEGQLTNSVHIAASDSSFDSDASDSGASSRHAMTTRSKRQKR